MSKTSSDKILFFFSHNFVYFAAAKSLQKKFNGEFYSIIDVNEQIKKFFQKQKLLNLKKTWYLRDHVSEITNQIDFNYLRDFEKKYHINLWLLAYGDRYFHKYNQYRDFQYDEILSILEKECKLFESILDEIRPTFFINRNPDTHQGKILHELCKAKNIHTFSVTNIRLANRAIISTDVEKIDDFDKEHSEFNPKDLSLTELQDYMNNYSRSHSIKIKKMGNLSSKKLKSSLAYFKVLSNPEFKKHYSNWGRTLPRVLNIELKNFFKIQKTNKFLNENAKLQIDKNKKFIYFPLHLEPEQILSIHSPFFMNQLEFINNLAKSIPIDYKLFVKEHPMISKWFSGRPIEYYENILRLPNVELIHPTVSGTTLIKNSSLVVTIAGTTGLEAAFYGIPSIVCSDLIYSSLSSIFQLHSLNDLPKLIRTALNKTIDSKELERFVHYIRSNSFEFEINELSNLSHELLLQNGFLENSIILESDVEKFLKNNEKEFDILSSEYLKKINHYKQKLD